jgi:hypothetical protein
MKKYKGTRNRDYSVVVTRDDGSVLDPSHSQKLVNHSPDGFNWGYAGSGPAQLALGLLYDCYASETLALKYYQQFKQQVVVDLKDNWEMTCDEIDAALIQIINMGIRQPITLP